LTSRCIGFDVLCQAAAERLVDLDPGIAATKRPRCYRGCSGAVEWIEAEPRLFLSCFVMMANNSYALARFTLHRVVTDLLCATGHVAELAAALLRLAMNSWRRSRS
jgi:hypothetical protein